MKKKQKILIGILIIICIIVIAVILIPGNKKEYISYKDFYNNLEEVEFVSILDDEIEFKKNGDSNVYYTENPNYDNLQNELLLKGISVSKNSTMELFEFIINLMIYTVFFGLILFAIHKYSQITGNNFKVIKHTNVKFDDIAGMDELKKEMVQIVDILKNSEKYKSQGIRTTKGIIFEGAPGNGKTLFAKALAEEMNVNFIATKGADFQSAMMSMGARKIKMLFKKARKCAPCIVFIDEFDGIGERRNYAGTGVDKENNRIITAMLNEMDGFDTKDGVLVIAATNSYNSLDSALIRPGRFDLKYNISNPDFNTRLKLIDLYTKNKKLDEKINKSNLADAFENLSCSAIETILNEASMISIMNKNENITIENIIVASQKVGCHIRIR